MRKILLLFSLFALISCKTTKKSNSEIYVSGYKSENMNIPSNLFLGFKNDSVFLIDYHTNGYDKYKQPKSKTDTIINGDEKIVVLKTDSLAKYEIYKNDVKYLENHFFKFKEEKNKTANDFLNKVKNKTFVTEIKKTPSSPNSDLEIRKYLKFENDNNVTINYDYYYENELMYSEFETQKFKILQINESLFLQILNSEIFPNRLYEIIKLKNNEFTLVHYAETKTIYDEYEMVHPNVEKSKAYQTCTDFRPDEYFNFGPDIRYKKGNKHLMQMLAKDTPLTKGNGYITIHFTINCNYEIGRFGVEQMDMNYDAAKYDKELIKHLITKIAEIKDWNSKRNLENDIHSFFMFKIENGKIIDLCP